MTKEERKKRALDYLKSYKKSHTQTTYGWDCQIWEDHYDVVSIRDAEKAIEIALGEYKW